MGTNDPAAGASPTQAAVSWREMAVARVLDPARLRAETRVQRFLDAARELTNGASGNAFTVQEVVERSGQSLRSFYQYFDGKHELLLALFEDSVRSTAAQLQDIIAEEPDALERLHRFAVEFYRLCRPAPRRRSGKQGPSPALGEFVQQLMTEHPKEASRAFLPLVSLVGEILDDVAQAGGIRPGLRLRRVAGVMLQAIMYNAFAATISDASIDDDGDDAEELWQILLHGIGTGTPT